MEKAGGLQEALGALIPAPKRARPGRGRLSLPARFRALAAGPGLEAAMAQAGRLFPGCSFLPGAKGPRLLVLALDGALPPSSHKLEIGRTGIFATGGSPEAVFHALQTLRQWVQLHPGTSLPELSVEDWPDFAVRAVSYDISRGRVPTLESLLELVDRLALLKVGQLQLYTEHSFRFRGHPLIGRGADPLDAADIEALDRACRERFIELVPSFASLGHMNRILELEPYRALAEDRAQGIYEEPGFDKRRAGLIHLPDAWTLAPGAPGAMDFLRSLLDEYLPLFSSSKFNACCDEPFDLGRGQSRGAVAERGLMGVYLGHVRALQSLAASHGKSLMIWGDVLRAHPSSLKDLPRDITVLDWDYRVGGDFTHLRGVVESGYLAYACPSANTWGSFFPRLGTAMDNIAGFARAGRESGAVGLLNTEWGDGGHFNLLENAWPGLAFGAEAGWNAGCTGEGFLQRFCRLAIGAPDPGLAQALESLGRMAAWHRDGGVEDYLSEAFLAHPGAAVFSSPAPQGAAGRTGLAEELDALAAALAQSRRGAPDPWGVLESLHFGAEALAHGARKAEVLGRGGAGRRLAGEAGRLRDRFEALWLARNRPSEIHLTLARLDVAIAALGGDVVPALRA